MKKRWWIILIFLVPLGLIAFWAMTFFVAPKEKGQKPLYKITKGTLAVTITEKGTLEPKEVSQLSPKDIINDKKKMLESVDDEDGSVYMFQGNDLPFQNFTIQRLTAKGTKVNKGDLLVEFDYAPVKTMLDQITNELKSFCDQYDQKINELKTQKRDLELKVEQARLTLDRAFESYDGLWKKIDTGEIKESSLEFQESSLQVKEQRRNLENTERESRIVKIILEEYTPDTSETTDKSEPKKVKPQDGKVVTSKTRSSAAYSVPKSATYYPADLRLEPREIVGRYLKPLIDIIKNIEDRQKKFDNLMKYPSPLVLYAPHAGHLFYGSHGQGGWYTQESQVKEGANFNLNQPVCYVTNTTDMKVPVNLDEININKIRKGLRVRITLEALPELVLNGKITEVGEIPGVRNPWEPSTGTEGKYPVVIELDESDPGLKPKMSAKAEIMCEEIKDVFLVPLEAIFEKEPGKKIIYVSVQGKPVERIVRTGKSNDNLIIVEEGLKGGEEVYLVDPFLKK
jgi:HlyD family secretion protein